MEQNVPEALLTRIRAALEQDQRVNVHRSPITVWSQNGQIVLEGMVEDIIAKRAAVYDTFKLTQGHWPVLDLLRVSPGKAMEDLALRNEITEILTQEPVFTEYTLTVAVDDEITTLHDAGRPACHIHLDIQNGVVTLIGQVESLSHKRLAEALTWWAAGCVSVNNLITVVPAQEDNDDELTDAVRLLLEKDPLVHADQLRVGAAGGVVELTGSVASEEEKRLAVLDAWYITGVWDVVDRIEVHR